VTIPQFHLKVPHFAGYILWVDGIGKVCTSGHVMGKVFSYLNLYYGCQDKFCHQVAVLVAVQCAIHDLTK
jgi:hypothetical protein